MATKNSVSALQELCTKIKFGQPVYTYNELTTGGFECRLDVAGVIAIGRAGNKKDSKHNAASQAIEKLQRKYPRLDFNYDTEYMNEEPPVMNCKTILAEYCKWNKHPAPVFEDATRPCYPQQLEFVFRCSIGNIVRYGVGLNKKEARKKSALEAINAVCEADGLVVD